MGNTDLDDRGFDTSLYDCVRGFGIRAIEDTLGGARSRKMNEVRPITISEISQFLDEAKKRIHTI